MKRTQSFFSTGSTSQTTSMLSRATLCHLSTQQQRWEAAMATCQIRVCSRRVSHRACNLRTWATDNLSSRTPDTTRDTARAGTVRFPRVSPLDASECCEAAIHNETTSNNLTTIILLYYDFFYQTNF